jgi:hypothetical protein
MQLSRLLGFLATGTVYLQPGLAQLAYSKGSELDAIVGPSAPNHNGLAVVACKTHLPLQGLFQSCLR